MISYDHRESKHSNRRLPMNSFYLTLLSYDRRLSLTLELYLSDVTSVHWLARVVQYVFEKKLKVRDAAEIQSGVDVRQHISQHSRGLVNDVQLPESTLINPSSVPRKLCGLMVYVGISRRWAQRSSLLCGQRQD
jgi:hypothetical protein